MIIRTKGEPTACLSRCADFLTDRFGRGATLNQDYKEKGLRNSRRGALLQRFFDSVQMHVTEAQKNADPSPLRHIAQGQRKPPHGHRSPATAIRLLSAPFARIDPPGVMVCPSSFFAQAHRVHESHRRRAQECHSRSAPRCSARLPGTCHARPRSAPLRGEASRGPRRFLASSSCAYFQNST